MPTNRLKRHPGALTLLLAGSIALMAAGQGLAASNTLDLKVTKPAVSITGSVAASGETVIVAYDRRLCAGSYSTESKHQIHTSTFHPKRTGAFSYRVAKSSLHFSLPPYACGYLVTRHKGRLVTLAAIGVAL